MLMPMFSVIAAPLLTAVGAVGLLAQALRKEELFVFPFRDDDDTAVFVLLNRAEYGEVLVVSETGGDPLEAIRTGMKVRVNGDEVTVETM